MMDAMRAGAHAHPEAPYTYDMPYAPPALAPGAAPAGLVGAAPPPAPPASGDAGVAGSALSDPAPPAGLPPTVYLATYSSVPVYEITVRGIALMRRRSDGYLNATQILKIAGIEKARRTRILEREILTGEHDKVQGGFGTFQGTWIPLQRAQELAMNYSVYHLIRPLLDFDPAASRAHGPSAPPARRKAESPHAPGAPAARAPRAWVSAGYRAPSCTVRASMRGGVPVLRRPSWKPARASASLSPTVLGSSPVCGRGSMRPAGRRTLPWRIVAARNVPVHSTTWRQGITSPEPAVSACYVRSVTPCTLAWWPSAPAPYASARPCTWPSRISRFGCERSMRWISVLYK